MSEFRLPGRPGPIRLRARVVREFRAGGDPTDIGDRHHHSIIPLLSERTCWLGGNVTLNWVLDAIRMGLGPRRG